VNKTVPFRLFSYLAEMIPLAVIICRLLQKLEISSAFQFAPRTDDFSLDATLALPFVIPAFWTEPFTPVISGAHA